MPMRTRASPPEPRAWLRRAAALLAGLAAAATTTTLAAAGFDLAQLTAQLARVKSGEATFTEKRRVEMLDRTLESSGRLVFRAPDTFIRETLKPRREKLEVSGSAERWSLELVPRDLRLRGQVASVRVSGHGATVREVQVLLADGDRSTMTIEPLAASAAR